MHLNSLQTWTEEIPRLSKRENVIHQFFLESAGVYTDREVMEQLKFTETNQVRPRITELIKRKLLFEVGHKKCATTGKKVRLVSVLNLVQDDS